MTDDLLRDALERALGDGYEVLRLLGRGGMGAVYLARETVLDRIVAIKVLPPEIPGQALSHIDATDSSQATIATAQVRAACADIEATAARFRRLS